MAMTRGALELRIRFQNRRAEEAKAKCQALQARIDKMNLRLALLNNSAWKKGEEAAGLRGLLSVMNERGCDMMRVKDGHCEFYRGRGK